VQDPQTKERTLQMAYLGGTIFYASDCSDETSTESGVLLVATTRLKSQVHDTPIESPGCLSGGIVLEQ